MKTKEIYEEMKYLGLSGDYKDQLSALEDGVFLSNFNFTQDQIEDVYSYVEKLKDDYEKKNSDIEDVIIDSIDCHGKVDISKALIALNDIGVNVASGEGDCQIVFNKLLRKHSI